jgi:hypothetical protein
MAQKGERAMATLEIVPIDRIDPNPHRDLKTYPWIERKLEHLKHSIKDVGMWEGIIARPGKRGRFEIAFGHHRLEAAKSLGMKEVPLIVRDLSDADMLRFMGRENGEDYTSDFLVMLNTWEGAVKFCASTHAQKYQAIDIAAFLGWTKLRADNREDRQKNIYGAMSSVARACHAAHVLIDGGYLARKDLDGLSVSTALEIVERAQSRVQFLEEQVTKQKVPHREFQTVKQRFGASVRHTAQEARQ